MYKNDQQGYEKMLKIISQQGNAKRKHNEIALPTTYY